MAFKKYKLVNTEDKSIKVKDKCELIKIVSTKNGYFEIGTVVTITKIHPSGRFDFKDEEENICEFCDPSCFKKINFFSLKDLKSGMIVETRNEYKYLVIDNLLIRDRGYMKKITYKNNLLHKEHKEFDIMKVFVILNWAFGYEGITDTINTDHIKCIWEREK